jgi:hypothetical protein
LPDGSHPGDGKRFEDYWGRTDEAINYQKWVANWLGCSSDSQVIIADNKEIRNGPLE